MISHSGSVATALSSGTTAPIYWVDIICAAYSGSNRNGFMFRSINAGAWADDFYYSSLLGTFGTVYGDSQSDGKSRLKGWPKISRSGNLSSAGVNIEICAANNSDSAIGQLLTERVNNRFYGSKCAHGIYIAGEKILFEAGRVHAVNWGNEWMTLAFTGKSQMMKGQIPQYEWGQERWVRVEDTKDNPDASNPVGQSSTVRGSAEGRYRKGALDSSLIFNSIIVGNGNIQNVPVIGENLIERGP